MTPTASTSSPPGSSGGEPGRAGSPRSTAAALGPRSTSRYSASDSWPVDRARPKCSFGRGEKPSVQATGSSARRRARSQHAGHVAVAGEADLAQLGEADAEPHRRHRPAGSRLAPSSVTGTAPPWRGPGRCPGCRRPAGRPRPRRARWRSRCRPRSRSRGSSGSPRGRPRRGRRASPARGSPCAARPRGGPRAGPRPRCGGGGRTQSRSRPWRAMASSHRSRSKCSLHSWKVPPWRHTSSMTGPRRRSPRGHDALDDGGLGVVPLELDALVAAGVVAQQVDLAAAAPRAVFCPNHWNGVNGLGTKPPTRHGDRRVLCGAFADLDAVAGQRRRCRGCPRRSRWAGR